MKPVISCAKAQDLWLSECSLSGASPYTVSSYKSLTSEALSHIASRHGKKTSALDIAHITRDDVVSALASYQSRPDKRSGQPVTRSASSVSTFHGALRSFFAWCVETEKLSTSPMSRVKTPRTPTRVPKAMSPEDCQALMRVADSSKTPERDRLALLLGLGMGLRLGEMATLTLESFRPSLDYPELLRVKGKGDKERVVPVPAQAVAALANYLPWRTAFLAEKKGTASTLFVSSRSDSGAYDVSRAGLGEVFERLVQASGLKVSGRRVHATRHSFATHVLGGGADVTEVSELLGHASVATTQIYLKVDPARLAAAVDNNTLLGEL